MKKYWNIYTDKFGLTVFHPQFFINNYNRAAINIVKSKSIEKSIVDFGCGRMNYKVFLLEKSKSYFGIDHPVESKNYSSNNKPDLLCLFEDTKLKSNYFDTSMMLEVLEYLDNTSSPENVLKEICRVTKKGGTFVMTSPFMYPIHDNKIDKNRFTPLKINLLLKSAGFKKVKVISQGNFFVFLTNSLLVYIFKYINSIDISFIKLFLIPPAILISTLLNLVTIPFSFIKDEDYPINILSIGTK